MQSANEAAVSGDGSGRVRVATQADAAALQRLLRDSARTHIHLDWHLPGDWLGDPGFMVSETDINWVRPSLSGISGLRGCLAIAADPLPAAWVRLAAVATEQDLPSFVEMMEGSVSALDDRIEEVAWFMIDNWPAEWLQDMGFIHDTNVISYLRTSTDVPTTPKPDNLVIRPVSEDDFSELATIEADAFAPLWRHSANGLYLAWRQSLSFEVAVIEGEPVGFQFSHQTLDGAHLSRMTVHSKWQGQGIGSALLVHALGGYQSQGLRSVSLNTQQENEPSQRLYERFGFHREGPEYPIWVRQL